VALAAITNNAKASVTVPSCVEDMSLLSFGERNAGRKPRSVMPHPAQRSPLFWCNLVTLALQRINWQKANLVTNTCQAKSADYET
jgi:hypothetical protein